MKRKYLVPCTLKNLVYVCALQLSEDLKLMSLVYLRFYRIEKFLFIFKSCVAIIYIAFSDLGDTLRKSKR